MGYSRLANIYSSTKSGGNSCTINDRFATSVEYKSHMNLGDSIETNAHAINCLTLESGNTQCGKTYYSTSDQSVDTCDCLDGFEDEDKTICKGEWTRKNPCGDDTCKDGLSTCVCWGNGVCKGTECVCNAGYDPSTKCASCLDGFVRQGGKCVKKQTYQLNRGDATCDNKGIGSNPVCMSKKCDIENDENCFEYIETCEQHIKDKNIAHKTCVYDNGATDNKGSNCCTGKFTSEYIITDPDVGVGKTYYYCEPCPSYTPPASSCFTSNSLVTMYYGDKKKISEIKVGELVMSAKGNKPSKVMIVDVEEVGNRALVGFNGLEPFVTEDHCFIGNDNKRLTFNIITSKLSKHWTSVDPIINGTELLDSKHNTVSVSKIVESHPEPTTCVYDLITSDHTYIVNDFKVYDDFPPIDDYAIETLVILELSKIADKLDLSHIKDKWDCKKMTSKFFADNIKTAMRKVGDDIKKSVDEIKESFDKRMIEYSSMIKKNNNLMYIGSDIWRHYIPTIKGMISCNV